MPLVTSAVRISKARKKNDPSLRPIKAGLNKQEKEIFDIYMRALSGMSSDMNNSNVLRAIQEAVAAGNPLDASIAFQWEEFISSLNSVVPNLANQVASSANISAKNLPKRISIESNFTAVDPRAIAWAQQRAGARIQGITRESQKAVAESIVNGLKGGLTRDEVITRLRKIVGLDARQARALGAFYEKNLQQLLEEGYTYEEALAEVTKTSEQYRQRLLTQRATRIARTETLAAANAGRMLSWGEADAQGILPADSMKRWKTATDERTCPVCKPMHNVAVQWQSSFSTGDVMPPAHPNCRCTAVIVPGTFTFEKSKERVIKQTRANGWLFVKHQAGKHDQKTHGRGAGGIQEELASWSPLDPIPKSPKNAGSVPAKAWENWEHGPDGNQMFSLHRQYAGEELGLDVPKSPFDEGGYNHYLTQRGYGGSSLETSREHAKSMLSAIEEGKPQPALYRGIMENDSGEAIALAADLRNLEVGDSIDMPLVSTTRSLGVATLYATDYGDKTGGQPILIKIQEGGKGISQAPQRSYYASDYEVITSGKFEVVSTGVVKAPFWNRDRVNVENLGNRANVWGSDKMDSYRNSEGEMPLSIYESIHQGATTGNFGGLVSETIKFTDSRGGQKLSPNFKYGDRIIVDRWERQPEIEFKVIELKMIDTHKVKKAKRDFGIKFDIFFASRVSDVSPLEPMEKHAPGKHDQKTHAGGRGGSGSYSASPNAISALNDNDLRRSKNYNEQEDNGALIYTRHYREPTRSDITETMAVYNYGEEGYKDINRYARTGELEPNMWTGETDTMRTELDGKIALIDKAIEESPDVFGDKNLYRVTSSRLLDDLQPGDTFIDKGFLSTTRIDISDKANTVTRIQLGNITATEDTVSVILPSPSGQGKGLALDFFLEQKGWLEDKMGSDSHYNREKEVLLPRGTPLLFLGFTETTGALPSGSMLVPLPKGPERVAVFQRMDK
jgi:SPP1 gp7 family putative phage head morphogenesis protein